MINASIRKNERSVNQNIIEIEPFKLCQLM